MVRARAPGGGAAVYWYGFLRQASNRQQRMSTSESFRAGVVYGGDSSNTAVVVLNTPHAHYVEGELLRRLQNNTMYVGYCRHCVLLSGEITL